MLDLYLKACAQAMEQASGYPTHLLQAEDMHFQQTGCPVAAHCKKNAQAVEVKEKKDLSTEKASAYYYHYSFF